MDEGWMRRTELLESLQRRPLMFGLDGSYSMYVGFFKGMELGAGVSWIGEFRLWLSETLGDGRNLSWESLVPRLAFPVDSSAWSPHRARKAVVDEVLVRELFSLLMQFDALYPSTD